MFLSLYLSFIHCDSALRKISVYYNDTKKSFYFIENVYDSSSPARGLYQDKINETGWGDLQIEGPRMMDDSIESRAAGFAEAILTGHLLKPHMRNIYSHLCQNFIKCPGNYTIPEDITKLFKNNYDWTRETVMASPLDDPYYFAAHMMIYQIDGLVEGYNYLYPNDPITVYDLWTYYGHSGIYDIARSLNMAKNPNPTPIIRRGTVIVGQTAQPDDVYMAQTAWRSYGEAQRLAKRYRIRYSSHFSSVDRRSLSGYPFMLHSDDDFYLTDNGLAIMSTSIALSNEYIKSVKYTPQGFPSWFRMIVSAQYSHSCEDWYQQYRPSPFYGAGIEYVVVDIKKFKYKQGFDDEFIYAVDEIPELIVGGDVTSRMRDRRFFGSYDVPFFEDVFKKAGYTVFSAESPDLYSYEQSIRAKILQRKAQSFSDFESMKKLIRLNDPATIEEQKGSTANAIAGRLELVRPMTDATCTGAYDAKVTSVGRMLHMMWVGQSGASHDDLPKLYLDHCDPCDFEAREGIPSYMANDWVHNYFEIEH